MILGWVFIHWLAALTNATFDPYLEGPQGGIWFWVMFGVGIAAMKMADEAIAAKDAPTPVGSDTEEPGGLSVAPRSAGADA